MYLAMGGTELGSSLRRATTRLSHKRQSRDFENAMPDNGETADVRLLLTMFRKFVFEYFNCARHTTALRKAFSRIEKRIVFVPSATFV